VKAKLIRHDKVVDETGDVIELKIWELPEPAEDKPHGYKYSLVYIVNGERVIGYDNTERKGDHRHYRDREESYEFKDVDKLFEDFYKDIGRVKNESKKG
jgi:hypothetical protein